METESTPHLHPAPARTFAERLRESFSGYFWFILKNVIGWTLIFSAFPVGVALPGPGGMPLFLIGFALVTFPGKRRLTARVMRGRRMQIEASVFTFITSLVSFLVMVVLALIIFNRYGEFLREQRQALAPGELTGAIVGIISTCLLAAAVTWLVTRLMLKFMNLVLHLMPRLRRFMRPWLQRHGFRLLPPRKRRLEGAVATTGDEEILEIHERHHHRLRAVWTGARPWLRRAVSLAITVAIFYWVFKPLVAGWPLVRGEVIHQGPVQLALRVFAASVMFAAFLFCFRALSWRRILIGFGHRLPIAPAARIWSISELARYLPGAIWQIVGRIYLIRPYGVSGSICSTSQLLEIAIFLLANVIVAVSCLLYFGVWQDTDGSARAWLFTALALVPALALILHPRIFYRIVDWLMRKLNKPPLVRRLSGRAMVALLLWAILGLLWQALAVWLITAPSLNLPLSKWWVVAGAYGLSWCAGFLAIWAPGGLGVREVVFMAAMIAVLPQLHDQFENTIELQGFLAFLSLLLRAWTTLGELLLAGFVMVFDYRGALNLPDAPGRIGVDPEFPENTPSAPTPQMADQRTV